jgi:hypothetical protein
MFISKKDPMLPHPILEEDKVAWIDEALRRNGYFGVAIEIAATIKSPAIKTACLKNIAVVALKNHCEHFSVKAGKQLPESKDKKEILEMIFAGCLNSLYINDADDAAKLLNRKLTLEQLEAFIKKNLGSGASGWYDKAVEAAELIEDGKARERNLQTIIRRCLKASLCHHNALKACQASKRKNVKSVKRIVHIFVEEQHCCDVEYTLEAIKLLSSGEYKKKYLKKLLEHLRKRGDTEDIYEVIDIFLEET